MTIAGLVCLCTVPPAAARAQHGDLRAGAAKVDITTPLAPGTDPPTGRFEHEHLYIRAIVLESGSSRAALLGADQAGLSEAIWTAASQRIAAELHCPLSSILMSATHTHSSGVPFQPGMTAAPNILSAQEKSVVDAMFEAVSQARSHLQPAQMSFGTGTAYLNVNRDTIDPVTHKWTQGPNPLAPSDKTVAVLTFSTLTGQPLGVYVNYAMHPVNGYLANFTSADFAGAMSRYVEQVYNDEPIVIFTQGASGDQNPLYMRPSTNGLASRSGVPITGNVLPRERVEQPLRDNLVPAKPMSPEVRERLERWMESEGDVLGEEVIRILTEAKDPERQVRLASSQTVVTCPGRTRTDSGREGMAGSYTHGPDVPIRLGALAIGNVVLTSVNAEIYTAIGERLKRQSPMAHTVVVTLANGRSTSGYIPDDASFGHQTFQVISSHLEEGCAEDAIANGLTKLVSASAKP